MFHTINYNVQLENEHDCKLYEERKETIVTGPNVLSSLVQ